VNEQTHRDDTHVGELDRFTAEAPSGSLTTIGPPLPYELEGFHCRVVTPQTERATGLVDSNAVGTDDGETVARGVVSEVVVSYDGLVELHVAPP